MAIERDKSQKEVLNINQGHHLVLAPPGCGKTDLLAERIGNALKNGTRPEDMLCLTFTNRAARGMRDRIDKDVKGFDTSKIFVGNIHRYCSTFLFDNKHVAMSTAILDEYDVYNIIQNILNLSENTDLDFQSKQKLDKVADIQHYIYQKKENHPEEVLLHKDCIRFKWRDIFVYNENGRDSKVGETFINLDKLCHLEGSDILSIYNHIEELCKKYNCFDCQLLPMVPLITDDPVYFRDDTPPIDDIEIRDTIIFLWAAKQYEKYKEDKKAIDFDDLLLKSYTIMSDPNSDHHRYSWIQIDEVQDLNPMQFAIADLLTSKETKACVTYLGDEQQAIFSFLGADMASLEKLKERCDGNLHRLEKNYRSPKYLLDLYNQFATEWLKINPKWLPTAGKEVEKPVGWLVKSSQPDSNKALLAAVGDAKLLAREPKIDDGDKQRVAIIVPTNQRADEVSEAFKAIGEKCFKVSGRDVFSTPTIQTLFSHLTIFNFELNIIAWAKIFRQLKLFNSYPNAYNRSIQFAKELRENMLSPTDLLEYRDSSYMQEFKKVYDDEYIIFDTETTGLDVYKDDIIQIAAIKIKMGKIIGEPFTVFLETDKPIPPKLGDIDNPMVEAHKKATKVKRDTGLKMFLDYVGSTPLLGHNAEYDYHILDYNLRRDCGINNLNDICPTYFDSLKIARLVEPYLRTYKLAKLLENLDVEGNNSHNAEDDIKATKAVVDRLMEELGDRMVAQQQFFEKNRGVIDTFKATYNTVYRHTKEILYQRNESGIALTEELRWLYNQLVYQQKIKECDKFEHIVNFLNNDVIQENEKGLSLHEQLSKHAIELMTFKEADLCDSNEMKERYFISTVQKAKGLEFENVIILDAIEGVYPYYTSETDEQIREDARKFYVAMSRAKHRLHFFTYQRKEVWSEKWGKFYYFDAIESRFLMSIWQK